MPRSVFLYSDSRILGGAELALLMLMVNLDRAAWRPVLLVDAVEGGETLARRARELELEVRSIPPMPLGAAGAIRTPAFVRLLRRERPDVFHAHLSWPLAAKYPLAGAVLARVPATVATVQLFPRFTLDRSNYLQLRALAAGVGCYIAVSQDVARQLVERLRWPARKIEVIYNAVEVERFNGRGDAAMRSRLSGGREGPIVLTSARLHEQKGHSVLLQAAAQVPDAVFALAGDGPEHRALEAQAAALGIADRVNFLGRRDDVPDLLAACDVFALPSLYEGSSLALLEAMAAGRPVVSSAIGGTRELITDEETGLLVPPADSEALARALRRLLADRALRTLLGERARERVAREFTPQRMAGRVQGIYEGLLDGGIRHGRN